MKNLKLILGLFVILLFIGACAPQRTVNTNGQATLKVDPDLAVVYVSIETLKDTAQASKNKNSEITDHVYAEMYKLGIERDKVETQNFNIYEEFDWNDGSRKSKGFRTSHMLKITTEEFDDVGEIVDGVIDVGESFTRINNINFELSDFKQKEFKKQVLAEASRDAKEKAEAIADGLGAKLGSIVSISDSTYDYRPYPIYAMGMAEDSMALEEAVKTQISPKSLDISANVQVVYSIK